MLIDDALKTIQDSRVFSRKQLFAMVSAVRPEITVHSFNWLLGDAKTRHILYQVGRDAYSKRPDTKADYNPMYSLQSEKLLSKMAGEYPELGYVVFETYLLNEFVNHMIAQNIIVIQIEKGLSQFTFEYLNSQFPGKVLFKPKADDIMRYRTSDSIIIEDLISESPVKKETPHVITVEKFLVDCVCDRIITELLAGSEISNIYDGALSQYKVDLNKVRRYASRRSAWPKVQDILKECER